MAYRVYRHLLDNGEFKEQEILLGRVSCFFIGSFRKYQYKKLAWLIFQVLVSFNQLQCPCSGIASLFRLPQGTEGNIGWHSFMVQIIFVNVSYRELTIKF